MVVQSGDTRHKAVSGRSQSAQHVAYCSQKCNIYTRHISDIPGTTDTRTRSHLLLPFACKKPIWLLNEVLERSRAGVGGLSALSRSSPNKAERYRASRVVAHLTTYKHSFTGHSAARRRPFFDCPKKPSHIVLKTWNRSWFGARPRAWGCVDEWFNVSVGLEWVRECDHVTLVQGIRGPILRLGQPHAHHHQDRERLQWLHASPRLCRTVQGKVTTIHSLIVI